MSEGNELPKGWVQVSVGEIASSIQYGHTASAIDDSVGPRFLRITDIQDGQVDWHIVPSCAIPKSEIPKYRLEPGDIVFARTGATTGKSYLIRDCPVAVFASYLIRLRMKQGVFAPYVQAFFQTSSYWRQIEGGKRGIGQPNVNANVLSQITLPLASENQQRRIVAKIEELFSDLDAGVAALKRAKANLKRYRAAVLKAAVEGRLTAEWRAKHPRTKPASKLLERILRERRQKWEADQLAKFAAAGKSPPKNWQSKYVEPTLPNTTDLPILPESWSWASVQQIGCVQLGRQRAPQHHNGPNMRPYLRVANVFEDRIDISDVMQMNFTPDEFETYQLSFGDILLNEGQSMELIGRPAMYRDEVPGACFTNTLVRFRPYDGVAADYALKVFLAYLKNGRFQRIASITVNIAHLGAGRFSEIEFPLAPLKEQVAIIEEVDRHFSLIDDAERFIETSLARASRLRQSILKQAFEGKLVPQDPGDEPANVLLDRLRTTVLTNDSSSIEQRKNTRPRTLLTKAHKS